MCVYINIKESFFTLKEDVDVADKALAADVRDSMEPWRLRLVSEPYPDSAWNPEGGKSMNRREETARTQKKYNPDNDKGSGNGRITEKGERFNYLKYNESLQPIGARNKWKEEIKSI